MTGNFTFHNPTKLYFGEEAIENLSKELENYGNNVMLVIYGMSMVAVPSSGTASMKP